MLSINKLFSKKLYEYLYFGMIWNVLFIFCAWLLFALQKNMCALRLFLSYSWSYTNLLVCLILLLSLANLYVSYLFICPLIHFFLFFVVIFFHWSFWSQNFVQVFKTSLTIEKCSKARRKLSKHEIHNIAFYWLP